MTVETLKSTADRLVAHCRANTTLEGLTELYADDAVSVEAMPGPGQDSAETHGLAGIRGKHEWWDSTMEVHSASVDGPFLHSADKFAVIFEFDGTNKTTSDRFHMREVAIYTVGSSGRIVREEFFYNG